MKQSEVIERKLKRLGRIIVRFRNIIFSNNQLVSRTNLTRASIHLIYMAVAERNILHLRVSGPSETSCKSLSTLSGSHQTLVYIRSCVYSPPSERREELPSRNLHLPK